MVLTLQIYNKKLVSSSFFTKIFCRPRLAHRFSPILRASEWALFFRLLRPLILTKSGDFIGKISTFSAPAAPPFSRLGTARFPPPKIFLALTPAGPF